MSLYDTDSAHLAYMTKRKSSIMDPKSSQPLGTKHKFMAQENTFEPQVNHYQSSPYQSSYNGFQTAPPPQPTHPPFGAFIKDNSSGSAIKLSKESSGKSDYGFEVVNAIRSGLSRRSDTA